MRTWTLAALSLATSLCTNAALKNHDADRLEINIPNLRPGVIASITLGYLIPNSYNNDYVLVDGVGSPNPQGYTKLIDPDETLTYEYMLGWQFCDTGWDLRAHVFHLDSNTGDSFKNGTNTWLWAIVGNVDDPDFIQRADTAQGDITYKVFLLDGQFSQHINIGHKVDMRWYWGASYVTLQREKQVGYTRVEPAVEEDEEPVNKTQIVNQKSQFDGFGPNVGVDMTYYLCHNIGLVGHVGGAMLYGGINGRTKSQVTPANKTAYIRHRNRTAVIPELDMNLGLDYSYQLCGGSVLRFELGYSMKHFFDSMTDINLVGGFSDATHHHGANHNACPESFTIHGAYLTIEGKV